MTEFILPAELSEEMTRSVKEKAIKAHKACECAGVSRVDFLISDGIPYILEINTSPGMTDTSDLPAQAAVMGISYDNLVLLILNNGSYANITLSILFNFILDNTLIISSSLFSFPKHSIGVISLSKHTFNLVFILSILSFFSLCPIKEYLIPRDFI